MEFYQTPFLFSLSQLAESTIIFSDGKKNLLAGDLYKKSIALAVGLREKGFQENDRLVLIAPPGKEFLEIFFASSMLKGTLSIIDPEMGRDNFESKLKQIDPQWMFIDSRLLFLREHPLLRSLYLKFSHRPFYFTFKNSAKVVATGKSLPLFGKHFRQSKIYTEPSRAISFGNDEDRELMVTYTSGTLAEPKGVVHSVGSLFSSLTKIKEILSSTREVRIAAYLPHFLLFGICSGNPVFLYNRNKPPKWIIRFIEQNNITTLFGPPSFYLPLMGYCRKKQRLLPNSLQLIILGSAPVHPKFLEILYTNAPKHAKVLCLYGMTENLIISTIDGKEKINSDFPGDVVGKPVEGISMSMANDGEILVQSPQLFSRYLHLSSRETPHHTGDLGYMAPDGTLVLNGRKKDMIIRRDTNIYPAIYEKTIKNIPKISEAVMIGVYSEPKHDEEVILVVESDNYSENELMNLLRSGKYSIDHEALPDKIIFRKIPLSGRQQKIDRKTLRAELVV